MSKRAEDARAEALDAERAIHAGTATIPQIRTWYNQHPARIGSTMAAAFERLFALTEAPPAGATSTLPEPEIRATDGLQDAEQRYARWWAELAPARDGMPYNALTLLQSIFAELGEQSRTIARLTREVPEWEPRDWANPNSEDAAARHAQKCAECNDPPGHLCDEYHRLAGASREHRDGDSNTGGL